jgi:hypothetical protein
MSIACVIKKIRNSPLCYMKGTLTYFLSCAWRCTGSMATWCRRRARAEAAGAGRGAKFMRGPDVPYRRSLASAPTLAPRNGMSTRSSAERAIVIPSRFIGHHPPEPPVRAGGFYCHPSRGATSLGGVEMVMDAGRLRRRARALRPRVMRQRRGNGHGAQLAVAHGAVTSAPYCSHQLRSPSSSGAAPAGTRSLTL